MNPGKILRLLALPAALTAMVSCATVEEPVPSRTVTGGQSLDKPPSTRYAPGVTSTGSTTTTSTTTTTIEDDLPSTGTTSSTTTTTTDSSSTPDASTSGATTSETTKPAEPAASTQPSYGKPVPGRGGFVYPPGVDAKPENMVDVRDFTPGQKVRDPRTGKIFLVP